MKTNDDRAEYIERLKRAFPLDAHPSLNDERYQALADYYFEYGLDPIRRQVWFREQNKNLGTKDNAVWVKDFMTGTSIDGLRSIAERTGLYQGQVGPYWCGEDGLWQDVWTKKGPPFAAKAGVYKKGFKEPLFAVALFNEFKGYGLWQTKPAMMIAKCAESQVLRRAFPELSGIYTDAEMSAADDEFVPQDKDQHYAQKSEDIEKMFDREKAQTAPVTKEDQPIVALKDDKTKPQRWKKGDLISRMPIDTAIAYGEWLETFKEPYLTKYAGYIARFKEVLVAAKATPRIERVEEKEDPKKIAETNKLFVQSLADKYGA